MIMLFKKSMKEILATALLVAASLFVSHSVMAADFDTHVTDNPDPNRGLAGSSGFVATASLLDSQVQAAYLWHPTAADNLGQVVVTALPILQLQMGYAVDDVIAFETFDATFYTKTATAGTLAAIGDTDENDFFVDPAGNTGLAEVPATSDGYYINKFGQASLDMAITNNRTALSATNLNLPAAWNDTDGEDPTTRFSLAGLNTETADIACRTIKGSDTMLITNSGTTTQSDHARMIGKVTSGDQSSDDAFDVTSCASGDGVHKCIQDNENNGYLYSVPITLSKSLSADPTGSAGGGQVIQGIKIDLAFAAHKAVFETNTLTSKDCTDADMY